MARPPLRAVDPDEKVPAAKPKSVLESLDCSSREVLVALRRTLAKKIDDGEIASNSIASAFKELRELDRLVRLIDDAQEDGARDDDTDESFDASAI